MSAASVASAAARAPHQPRRGRMWALYWDAAADDAHAAEESGEQARADLFGEPGGPKGQPSTRQAILHAVDRFLSVTNLVREVVRDPADVVAAQHVLHLPFSSLCHCPEHLRPRLGHEFTMPLRAELDEDRPQLVLDCIAYLAHEELLLLCPPAHTDAAHTAARLASRRLRVRLHDRDNKAFWLTPLSDLKADKIRRMVVVKGAVIRYAAAPEPRRAQPGAALEAERL